MIIDTKDLRDLLDRYDSELKYFTKRAQVDMITDGCIRTDDVRHFNMLVVALNKAHEQLHTDLHSIFAEVD